MPNGDDAYLKIKGLIVTALPEEVKIETKRIGDNIYTYTLDLKDIPKDKRWLTIEIDFTWI